MTRRSRLTVEETTRGLQTLTRLADRAAREEMREMAAGIAERYGEQMIATRIRALPAKEAVDGAAAATSPARRSTFPDTQDAADAMWRAISRP